MKPYYDHDGLTLYVGGALEALRGLPDHSVDCVVTSPPYYLLRDYDVAGQIGGEETLEEYVEALVGVFAECRRLLSKRGVLWLNLGDTHASAPRGTRSGATSRLTTPGRQERVSPVVNRRGRAPKVKPKDLYLVPFEVARALRDDGWWIRQTVIWDKTNTVPESAKDRPTTSHEYLFLLSKSKRYWYDGDAIAEPATWERWGRQTNRKHSEKAHVHKASLVKERSYEETIAFSAGLGARHAAARAAAGPAGQDETAEMPVTMTRNARSVWRINAANFPGSHDAVMPNELARRCVLAGCPKGGVVLDPFAGAGTTLAIAKREGRRGVGVELNPANAELAVELRLERWWLDPWRPPAQPETQLSLEEARS